MIADLDQLAEQAGIERSAMIRRLLVEGSRRLSDREARQKAKIKRHEAIQKEIIEEVVSEAAPSPEPITTRSPRFKKRRLSAEEVRAIADRAERRRS